MCLRLFLCTVKIFKYFLSVRRLLFSLRMEKRNMWSSMRPPPWAERSGRKVWVAYANRISEIAGASHVSYGGVGSLAFFEGAKALKNCFNWNTGGVVHFCFVLRPNRTKCPGNQLDYAKAVGRVHNLQKAKSIVNKTYNVELVHITDSWF